MPQLNYVLVKYLPSGFLKIIVELVAIQGIRARKKICCPILTSSVSGSPILQNGQIVGAVTHVLLNDPTKGYGISIENMLKAAE